MKYLIVVLFLALTFNSATAEKAPTPKFSLKKIEKQMVLVKDSLYASSFECTNLDYKHFYEEVCKTLNAEDLGKLRIDSTLWRDLRYYCEPFVFYYHSYPAYHNYPVVNISQSAAKAYCAWLTEKYNMWDGRKFKKVLFHLPTEKDWILAAKNGNEKSMNRFPVFYSNGYFLEDNHGKMQANFKHIDQGALLYDGDYDIPHNNKLHFQAMYGAIQGESLYLSHVKSYHPTKLGIYNLAGNAAEMLDENGRTKGGSWNSLGGYLGINAPDPFLGFINANAEIGFRVFMTVIEK